MEKIRQYLIDFQTKKFETFDRELKIKLTKEFITSIIGARRVGKTYFLFNLINKIKDRKKVLYIDFDMPEFLDFDGKNLKELVNLHLQLFGSLEYIFFDEIQNIKNWHLGLKEIYEEKKYFIFITGSSSKLLSKELATQLRGRTITYTLYPLSLREIFAIKNLTFRKNLISTSELNKIIFEFNQYLEFGGYPQIFKEPELKDQIVKDYKDLVLFRDIVERYNIKNIYVIKRFFEYLISSFAKEISIDKFYNYLKSQNVSLSKKTLYNYLEYFESSLFFHFLRTYKIKERIKKAYLNDIVFVDKNEGRKLENIVFIELKKKEENVYYFKNNFECDFVVPSKSAIQVVWELNEDNKKREINGLLEAMRYFRIKKGIILTYNQQQEIKEGQYKIKVIPVWRWLLYGDI
jgi:predicted AAA+ superfamily ATPase